MWLWPSPLSATQGVPLLVSTSFTSNLCHCDQAEYYLHLVCQEVDRKSMYPREHVGSGVLHPHLEILFSRSHLKVLIVLLLWLKGGPKRDTGPEELFQLAKPVRMRP